MSWWTTPPGTPPPHELQQLTFLAFVPYIVLLIEIHMGILILILVHIRPLRPLLIAPRPGQHLFGNLNKACACRNATPPEAAVTGAVSAAPETRERSVPGLLVSDPMFSSGILLFWKKLPRRVFSSPRRLWNHHTLQTVKRNTALTASITSIAPQSCSQPAAACSATVCGLVVVGAIVDVGVAVVVVDAIAAVGVEIRVAVVDAATGCP